ncbi:MAG: HU family DNA-binding protein [Myxococcota bacterium]
MKWKDIVRETATKAGLSGRATEAVLDAFIATLSDVMSTPTFERVALPSIGSFAVAWSYPRVVRSPRDRKRLFLDGRWRITFRPSDALKRRVAAQSTQLWQREEHQTAWRLAETLVSDLQMYHPTIAPANIRPQLPDDEVRSAAAAAFGVHWQRVIKTYEQSVDDATRRERDHLAAAVRGRWSAQQTEKERRVATPLRGATPITRKQARPVDKGRAHGHQPPRPDNP